MTDRVGFGFLGCGEIARETAAYLADSPVAHLVVVMDPVEGLARALAATTGAGWTTRTDDVLTHPDVDAVYIAAPHDLHADLAVAALRAGKHVLVEKPVATTLHDADVMIETAAAEGRVLSVAFSAQSDPAAVAVRDLLRAGGLGRVTGTSVVRRLDKPVHYWSEGYERINVDDWRGSRARAGGGVLLMNAIHGLNTMRFVTGLEVEHISCELDTFASRVEVEDHAAAVYRYVGGAIGTVEAGAAVRGGDPDDAADRVYGERGQVLLGEDPQVYLSEPWGDLPAGRWLPLPYAALRSPRSQPDSHPELVDAFARACLTGQEPPVTGRDGRAALEIVLAAYESGLTGRRVTLPLDPTDHAGAVAGPDAAHHDDHETGER